jgi:hypothetical protein
VVKLRGVWGRGYKEKLGKRREERRGVEEERKFELARTSEEKSAGTEL